MIVLDTTVLVYAVGDDHALRESARTLIRAVGEGRLAATTTVEVIQEFAHVRARRRGRTEAASLSRSYATLLTPLTTVTAADLARGLDLFDAASDEGGRALGAFDAVLAAVAFRLGAGLVSADAAFTSALGDRHIPLGDPARIEASVDRT